MEKRFLFITLILLIGAVNFAQGYIISLDAPKTVIKGNPLVVTGTTTFPEDSYFDLVLFYSKYTANEVARTRVIVDKTQLFRADFDTRHLERGQYKVEVHNIVSGNELFVERQLGSSSTIRRIVQIEDRSDEITITSPSTQPLTQALTISGRMRGVGDSVLTMRIFGPDTFTYGPVQVITRKGFADTSGDFSATIPVSLPGEYHAGISDKNGYIGEYTFIVTEDTPEQTQTALPKPTAEETQELVISVKDTPFSSPTPTPTKQAGIGTPGIIVLMTCLVLLLGKKK